MGDIILDLIPTEKCVEVIERFFEREREMSGKGIGAMVHLLSRASYNPADNQKLLRIKNKCLHILCVGAFSPEFRAADNFPILSGCDNLQSDLYENTVDYELIWSMIFAIERNFYKHSYSDHNQNYYDLFFEMICNRLVNSTPDDLNYIKNMAKIYNSFLKLFIGHSLFPVDTEKMHCQIARSALKIMKDNLNSTDIVLDYFLRSSLDFIEFHGDSNWIISDLWNYLQKLWNGSVPVDMVLCVKLVSFIVSVTVESHHKSLILPAAGIKTESRNKSVESSKDCCETETGEHKSNNDESKPIHNAVIWPEVQKIISDDIFWKIVIIGIGENDFDVRKRALRTLKQVFSVVPHVGHFNCMFVSNHGVKNHSYWKDYYLSLEALEESQLHIVQNSMKTIKYLWKFIIHGDIHPLFFFVILKRMLNHENKSVRLWAIETFVGLEMSSEKMTGSFATFFVECIIPAMKDFSLLDDAKSAKASIGNATIDKVSSLMSNIFDALGDESEKKVYFVSVLNSILKDLLWEDISVLRAIKMLETFPVFPCLDFEDCFKIITLANAMWGNHDIIPRRASKSALFRILLDHLDATVSWNDFVVITYSFGSVSFLFDNFMNWNAALTWLKMYKSIDTTGENVIKESELSKNYLSNPDYVALECLLISNLNESEIRIDMDRFGLKLEDLVKCCADLLYGLISVHENHQMEKFSSKVYDYVIIPLEANANAILNSDIDECYISYAEIIQNLEKVSLSCPKVEDYLSRSGRLIADQLDMKDETSQKCPRSLHLINILR